MAIRLSKKILNCIYPVGAIYMSTNSTNPKDLFGGTWEQIKDRFLLACGSAYSNGSTGGEETHTLTIDEMPSHTHSMYGGDGQRNADNGSDWGKQGVNVLSKEIATTFTGGSQPHNNMPPYLAVYMWKRTG